MNLCKDCKHFEGHMAHVECTAPGNFQPDFVNGGKRAKQQSAQVLRMCDGYCGPDATWFETRVEPMAAAA